MRIGNFILLIVLTLFSGTALAQLSPGDLADPHAHLEGLANCTKCHDLGKSVSNQKCLDCHDQLSKRILTNKGFHASTMVKGKNCIECHSDHHGRGFDMLHFDTTDFKHQLTGYQLEGAHSELSCKKCHNKSHISNPEILNKKSTYLGLNTNCLSCHKDYHQQTLGAECVNCHDLEAFVPAKKFNHRNTDFLLKGKHKALECTECHEKTTRNGKEFQRFSGIVFGSCGDCHEDPHKKRFGQQCSECHNELSFQQTGPLNDFDHRKTDFPLQGKHLQLDCKECHTGSYTKPIAHNSCTDCHDDYHEGQLTKNGSVRDCDECHTVESFQGSSFSINKHNQSEFPLEGAHMATPCTECHKENEKWQFADLGNTCNDCHEDPHKYLISEKYYPQSDCEKCHKVSRWSEVNFDHSLTGYELQGQHQELSCRDCHFRKDEKGDVHQQFKTLSESCTNCHTDQHYGQFEEKGKTTCEQCHTFNDWGPTRFDHNKTRFKLVGAHADVACEKCHQPIVENGITYIQYKYKEVSCETCH
jgi:hypothetical protein